MANVDAEIARMSRLVSSLFCDAINAAIEAFFRSFCSALSGGASPIKPTMAAAFANTIPAARRNVLLRPSR